MKNKHLYLTMQYFMSYLIFKMKFYERWLQPLLSSAHHSFTARSRVLVRLASLAQIGELARRLKHSLEDNRRRFNISEP